MSNKKQTIMQEFLGELQIRLLIIKSEPNGLVRETMISNFLIDSDRYLAMEKEQIENAFCDGNDHEPLEVPKDSAEQYYL